MDTKQKILAYLEERGYATSKELVAFLKISRQAVNKHVQHLILEGRIEKRGVTKGAVYVLTEKKPFLELRYQKRLRLQEVEEDRILENLVLTLALKKRLSTPAYDIFNYAFTEMLNNAVEHSQSEWCQVLVNLSQYNITFVVRDFGIGLYYSLVSKLGLPDEVTALRELVKGKVTTQKDRHTGGGIFFTSKCADVISFSSHRLLLTFDNLERDVVVKEIRFKKGTEVKFSIKRNSRRQLRNILQQYAPEEFDYRFQRTRVMVKLYQSTYLSRSEARRLLIGLGRFKEVILDFSQVKSLGQSFADEIFRVYQHRYPHIHFKVENASPPIRMIIDHVVDK